MSFLRGLKSEKRKLGPRVGFADISQRSGQWSFKTGFSGKGLGRVLRKTPLVPCKMQIKNFVVRLSNIHYFAIVRSRVAHCKKEEYRGIYPFVKEKSKRYSLAFVFVFSSEKTLFTRLNTHHAYTLVDISFLTVLCTHCRMFVTRTYNSLKWP